MPTFSKVTAGGKAISGGSLNLRGRRGNTAQVDGYWRGGGGNFPATIEYLIIAGGGGAGGRGGGGGAGGYRTSVIGATTGGGGAAESVLPVSGGTAYTVTVGAGSVGNALSNGSDSVFGSITSTGGGGGGDGTPSVGNSGGSGGGGGGYEWTDGRRAGGAAVSPTQGYAGGLGADFTYYLTATGGGGGGAGAVGGGGAAAAAGPGGNGLSNSITGTAVTRGGGGAGGIDGRDGGGAASGGTGGGGNSGASAQDGTVNTGGGAGGKGVNVGSLTKGGSGIVIIRYPDGFDNLSSIDAGLTYTLSVTGGYKIYSFTAGTGTVVV